MRVSELMSSPAVTAAPSASLRSIAELMGVHGVGAVVVTDSRPPIGIVTDRDLVLRGLACGLDPESAASAVMTTPVITLSVDDGTADAYRVYRRSGVRRLPVVDGHRTVGILTVDDMLMDVFRRMADLLSGPIADSVLAEYLDPRSARREGPGGRT
ncbi:cyclic nucleotide-binding/CBS domain-containing protein [Streptomyces sp. NPDC020412]|uniref:cyclic nucleotide-binding/CBS domain-containing protein n=1 Tax=Streptomyces sp. NPDC020412 TaxID=3365073 RepID=UPI003790DEA7